MDIISFFTALVQFVLHIDTHLVTLTNEYGLLVYVILFLIIFAETGLVIAPILPGDSLLFAVGALAAIDSLNVYVLLLSLTIAAILGDALNYTIGRYVGLKAFKKDAMFLKTEYLDKTKSFYAKYGKKTIVIARFMPIVRTFAPFVAGASDMHYPTFAKYNIIGGLLWIFLFIVGGYLFGNIPFVKENFSLVILGIIILSIVPGVIEFLRAKYGSSDSSKTHRKKIAFRAK